MDYKFFSLLSNDIVVLTANRRLASQLQREYAKYQKMQGRTAWETPNILPLSTWLNLLWKAQNDKPLLSDFQERCLWKKISEQPWSSISLIQQAWKNLALWNVPLDALNDQHNDSSDAFLFWAREFKTQCESMGCLTSAEIPAQLKIEGGTKTQCLLVGFDDLPPAIEDFLNQYCCPKGRSMYSPINFACTNPVRANGNLRGALDSSLETPTPVGSRDKPRSIRRANTTIRDTDHFSWTPDQARNEEPMDISTHKTTLENSELEIQAMAQWAKEKFEENNSKKIGCIIPNLSQVRMQAYRIFKETFSNKNLFNISAAQNLTEFSIIQHAINVLELCQGERKEIAWEILLQSPYLSMSDDDINLGALVDEKRRETLEIDFPLSALLPIFTAFHSHFPNTTWLKRWRTLLNKIKMLPKKQIPQDWSNSFIDLLKTLGWPGHRTLDSVEHQVFTRFTKALDEFSQCDDIFHEIDYDSALNIFIYQISTVPFQAEGSETPIQVLGLLEASGIHFDSLWVMGLHDEAWPPTASPNPFIPHTLQIKHKMPHSSAARELEFTVNMMKRLLTSAKEIILSSPLQQKDKSLQPSRFIKNYPEFTFNFSEKNFPSNNKLEVIEDHQGPAISKTETTQGGSWILKQQAICPFSAFATIRLHAQSPGQTYIGISPQEKGTLLHRILESIWIELKDQNTLLKLPENDLIKTIEKVVSSEIDNVSTHFQSKSHLHFLRLEQKRLIQIVKEWLYIEKARPPFSVLEHETKRHISIGPLELNLQIDRIDELYNGKQLIIDYKSSLTNTAHWFTDRPLEPQLPLYCAYGQRDYAGAAYAQIHPSKMTFKGICEEGFSEPPAAGITSMDRSRNADNIHDWNTMISHWKATLSALGESFYAGDARIAPLETACHFCDLQPLCRVQDHE